MAAPWSLPAGSDPAAASTAIATWWLVAVTIFAASATAAAVVAAFWVQVRQFKHEALDARQKERRINLAALCAIEDAAQFVQACEVARRGTPVVYPEDVWDMIGDADAHRRTIEWHLSQGITHQMIPWLASQIIQRLFEVRAGLEKLPLDARVPPEEARAASYGTLQTAAIRTGRVLAKLDEVRVAVADGS